MIKVLFVCLGNICRSPIAKAVFSQRLKEENLENAVYVDSCGTTDYHEGEPADERTANILAEKGIPFEHTARPLDMMDYFDFNYIIAMDSKNLKDIKQLKPDGCEARIFLMRDFEGSGKQNDVPDPYWGGEDGFENVYNTLRKSCDGLLEYIIDEHALQENS